MAKTYYPFHAIVKNEVELTDSGYETTIVLHNGESVQLSDEPNQNALASVEGTTRQEMFWADDSRPAPHITGVDNVSIWEGEAFDPMAGVSAVDWEGNTVPVTYSGTVDPAPGTYRLVYEAVDSEGRTARKTRIVTVNELEAPHFTGITPIRVKQGALIDLTDGVKAWLGSTEISYTYSPTSVIMCDVGTTTVTYTATGNGKTTTVDREVTISQAEPPTITGNTPLTVYVNTEFDPLDGITAVDANGNPVTVELADPTYKLTRNIAGGVTQQVYLKDLVVPLRPLPLTDRQRFDGWYDNASMTGTAITSVTMTEDKQIWAKITDLAAYASYDSATTTFRVFVDEEGKYTNGQVVGTTTYYTGWEDTLNALPWTSESWKGDVTTARIDDVIHPSKMDSFFSGMTSLSTITGLWRIDVSKVSSLTTTFSNTSSLTKPIDLSSWAIGANRTVTCNSLFSGSGVTSINLCNWVSANIPNISSMFRQCTGLTTIYVSPGFDLSHLADPFAGAVFTGDVNLVGGQGTTYDSSYVRAAYARIDGGVNAPGYFTER